MVSGKIDDEGLRRTRIERLHKRRGLAVRQGEDDGIDRSPGNRIRIE